MLKAPTKDEKDVRENEPIKKGKYKAIVYLANNEKVYASEVNESDTHVTGRVCNYDNSDGGAFEFSNDFVRGVVRKD